jgi:ubiquinone/menaquinone biosynthesis C-methylase UbiE
MKLNAAEKALMNNPVRALVQRYYEAPLLERLGGRVAGGRVLEMGCGQGVGSEIILTRFGAREIVAFDLDPDMVSRARRRLARWGDRVRFEVGDAACIPAPDAHFDAVFDFGIIHHVPEWRQAIGEVSRVLRPGGQFCFEEVTRHALDRPSYRVLFDHPREDRFGAEDLVAELERSGIVVGRTVERFFGDFVIGVGERLTSDLRHN